MKIQKISLITRTIRFVIIQLNAQATTKILLPWISFNAIAQVKIKKH
jgi:hypothetical protein